MRDVHCHILPGVDDGSPDLETSISMLEAAQAVGIDAITCTPHVREPYFTDDSYNQMWDAFEELYPHAEERGIQLQMGFEVNHAMFMGMDAGWIELLAFDMQTAPVKNGRTTRPEFLLELGVTAPASYYQEEYARTIYQLQGMGYTVIIAHPERYLAIQEDISLAEQLVNMGCKLQASCDYIVGGRFGKERKPAAEMLKRGLYSLLASDAHRPEHYDVFARALKDFRENR